MTNDAKGGPGGEVLSWETAAAKVRVSRTDAAAVSNDGAKLGAANCVVGCAVSATITEAAHGEGLW